MSFFSWLNDSSSNELPPIHLDNNQEYTEEGYLITRNEDGEITKVVNWQALQVEEEESLPWLAKLFG